MPALRLPEKPKYAAVPQFESRVPKPDELVVLNQTLLNSTVTIGKILQDCSNKWALGGDVAEVISGVNVVPDHISLLTSRDGCTEILGKLAQYHPETPGMVEKELDREANVDFHSHRIKIKSYTSGMNVEGSSVKVHGDLQIKVGDWEWGDPIDFEPDHVNVIGVEIPIVPLKLKTDLYTGLGWTDRAAKIHEAVKRSRHMFG